MTPDELADIQAIMYGSPVLDVADLSDQRDRTLLLGYLLDRTNLHVYLKDGHVYRHHYTHDYTNRERRTVVTIGIVDFGSVVADARNLIPDKRLYPDACDFEVCAILARQGLRCMAFTSPLGTAIPSNGFWGETAKMPEADATLGMVR